ncbi:hypothetical protein, partial [Desulfovibrio sp.]|uniref:hypothetical protein n=1 Tax=Desulfovibrio sp. TaxID=885 RepID=UPI003FD6FA30
MRHLHPAFQGGLVMRPPFSFSGRAAGHFLCRHAFFAQKAGSRSEYGKNFKKNFIKNRSRLRFFSLFSIPMH